MSVLDPTNAIYSTGTDEERLAARREWNRQRWVAQVMRSDLEELPRSSLTFRRFGVVEHVNGRLYRARRDQIADLSFVPDAVGYYCDSAGIPVLLEPPPSGSPQTVDEAEAQRVAREQRRSQRPRARRAWMTR